MFRLVQLTAFFRLDWLLDVFAGNVDLLPGIDNRFIFLLRELARGRVSLCQSAPSAAEGLIYRLQLAG